MKRLLLCLLLASPLQASPKHFFTDKKSLAGVAIIFTSTSLDAISTCQHIHAGIETGGSLISSCKGAVGISLAAASFYTVLHYAEWHFGHDDPNKYWRFASYWAIPTVAASIHIPAAVHNWELPTPGEKQLTKHLSKRSTDANNQ